MLRFLEGGQTAPIPARLTSHRTDPNQLLTEPTNPAVMDFQAALSALPDRRSWAVETHDDGAMLTAVVWLLCWPSGATAPRVEVRGTLYRNERPDGATEVLAARNRWTGPGEEIESPWWMPERSFGGREHAAEVPRTVRRLDWTPTEAAREEFVHSDLDTVGQQIKVLRGETVEVAAYGGSTPPFGGATVEHHDG